MLLYSASTNGFYLRRLHGDDIPGDAIEITDEEHRVLLEGQTAGKVIAAGTDGRPRLIERTVQAARKRQAPSK